MPQFPVNRLSLAAFATSKHGAYVSLSQTSDTTPFTKLIIAGR